MSWWPWPPVRVWDLVDIALVALVLYRVFVMFQGTRALQMLVGLGGLLIASFFAHRLQMPSTTWILENFWSFWVLALIVLFQPEFRRALAQIGQSRIFQGVARASREAQGQVIDEVIKAADALAAKRMGALIVLERTTGLRHYAELGVRMDALVSTDLLVSLFLPYSPLHDGAAIVGGNRVAAAGCFLPLSRNTQLARALGTRHRAALGLSEETDAVVLAVSEETGRITLSVEGQMETPLDREALRRRLLELFGLDTTRAERSAWAPALLARMRK